MSKTGVVLINLGTPNAATKKSVRRYLRQFLNDPRVINLPSLIRFLLVHAVIIPFRTKASTKAYQAIWTPEGSPLLRNSLSLLEKVSAELGDAYQVVLGMRYGEPSIASAFAQLIACDTVIVVPLFPQYSSAATGTAIEESLSHIKKRWNVPTIKVLHTFYDEPAFIEPYAAQIKQSMTETHPDLVIFSYHGLPESHLVKSDCRASCDKQGHCPTIGEHNVFCYRAQCYASSTALAQAAGLSQEQYRVSFQSRLGRTPWIKPYTDDLLTELASQGIKNISIACPAFVADCLETLEEIAIRARDQWRSLGGDALTLIPCLNDNQSWSAGLAKMIQSL